MVKQDPHGPKSELRKLKVLPALETITRCCPFFIGNLTLFQFKVFRGFEEFRDVAEGISDPIGH
jgi:hypothetical protein